MTTRGQVRTPKKTPIKVPSGLVMQVRLLGNLGALVDAVSDGKPLLPQTLHLVGLAIRALRNSDVISDDEERRGDIERVKSLLEAGKKRLHGFKGTKQDRFLEAIEFVTQNYLDLWDHGYVRLVQRIQRMSVDKDSDTGSLYEVMIKVDPRQATINPCYVGTEALALLVVARHEISAGARNLRRWDVVLRDYLVATNLMEARISKPRRVAAKKLVRKMR